MFYLLHGPNEFGSAEFVAELKESLGDPATVSLNTTLLDGKSVALPELRSICSSLPFLAAQRLVIVEGWLTRLLGRGEEEGENAPSASAKETLAAITEYLPTVPDTTLLVFVEPRTLPERNPALKAAAGQSWATVRLFDAPKGETLVRWIMARAKAKGGAISREAAQTLAGLETDLRTLGNEITKLLTYVNYARPVDLADVETLTPAGGEAKVFEMVDAVGQRKGPQAIRELRKLLEKEDPLYVLGMIVRQFRLMLLAREMLEARATEADISHALGLHPFPTGKVCAQARHYSLASLERIYRRLLDYDAEIKTGRVDPMTALDTLVASLTTA
jgi:DNA polymerase-3 subunit delta